MHSLLAFAAVTFSSIFFVVDPIALVPIFLGMTHGDTPEKKRATAGKAALATTLTLLIFAGAGGLIFQAFGITLGAFKIAGGILLFRMALDMMQAQHSRTRTSPEEEAEGAHTEDVAVIPLAIPMLAGPGAIATVMVVMGRTGFEPVKVLVVLGSILLTGGLAYVILRSALLVERRLKTTGMHILSRVTGLLVAAVAVQFVVDGARDVRPQIVEAAP